MRISVNLATRPFVELRPFFLRLRLLMAALAVLGIALAGGAHVISAKAETQQIEMDRLRNLTIATQRAKLETEQRLRQPANAAVLDRAHFLNTLFLRKSFSWTAVMMDLEDVLPAGVQVTSIEPAVTANGAVTIRLRVAGERDRAVQLVRNLERSRRFLQPRLGSEAAQAKETTGTNGQRVVQGALNAGGVPLPPPGVEFEILAVYNPLPAGEAYKPGHARSAVGGDMPARSGGSETAAVERGPVEAERPGAGSTAVAEPVRSAATEGVGKGAGEAISGGNANGRRGYPRDGVVLPPYGRPPRLQDGRILPQPPNAGGPL